MHICQRETQICFCHICRLLVVRWSIEEYFKVHSMDYRKPLEILHWDALVHMKKLLEWPMFVSLSLESDKHVMAGKTLKHLTKLLDRLHGIALGYDEGMESRTVMVPANGMVHKLREELKNDGALLFGLIFLAHLDIGGVVARRSRIFPVAFARRSPKSLAATGPVVRSGSAV